MPLVLALLVLAVSGLGFYFFNRLSRAKSEAKKSSHSRVSPKKHSGSGLIRQSAIQHTNNSSVKKMRAMKVVYRPSAHMKQQSLKRERVFKHHTKRFDTQRKNFYINLVQVSTFYQQVYKRYNEIHMHLFEFKIEPCIEIRADGKRMFFL